MGTSHKNDYIFVLGLVDWLHTTLPYETNDSYADMMTSSNGNPFRVTGHLCGEFTGPRWIPAQRPVTRSFDVFFDRRLNERLSKQPWGWWFETLSRPLWRHRNGTRYCLVLPHFGLWLLLWTWFNFNPSMDILKCEMKLLIHSQVSEWISNFIVHLTGHGTTYPCLD